MVNPNLCFFQSVGNYFQIIYYVFQRLCYIVFLEYQYISVRSLILPLIFVTIVQYQRDVSKVHTLDTWKEIANGNNSNRTGAA